MEKQIEHIIQESIVRHPVLQELKPSIMDAFNVLLQSIQSGGKILSCGNGGSAADANHLVSELMKNFVIKRGMDDAYSSLIQSGKISSNLQSAIRALSLNSQTALMTAIINDQEADLVFAQQILGYGDEGDILFAISTSGASKNVIEAARTAQALGLKVIALTGTNYAELNNHSDVIIACPGRNAGEIQEVHLPVYHLLCLMLETYLFSD